MPITRQTIKNKTYLFILNKNNVLKRLEIDEKIKINNKTY